MKKRAQSKLWIIISALLLIIAVYFYYHNTQPGLRDTDGNDPFRRGEVYKRQFIGWSLIGIDNCDGNDMPEQVVTRDLQKENLYYISYEITYCQNGCIDGACLN